ncbi:MAG: pseudouridine synthase [Armatimonadota bacterium]
MEEESRGERLQKALAAAGVSSRRNAEVLITSGRVKVNGVLVTQLGTTVSDDDVIFVDNKQISRKPKLYYVALNKPAGVVSTVHDRHADTTVVDLVDIPNARLVPCGRLDMESEGLILLSNDGDFVHKVTHPSQSLGKTYHVTVFGGPEPATLRRLANGLTLDDDTRPTAPAEVTVIRRRPTVIEMVLHEGRNRQIRRMMDTVGHPVERLVRVKVGPIQLGDLRPGEWRFLDRTEVGSILKDTATKLSGNNTSARSGESVGTVGKNGTGRPRAGGRGDYETRNRSRSR